MNNHETTPGPQPVAAGQPRGRRRKPVKGVLVAFVGGLLLGSVVTAFVIRNQGEPRTNTATNSEAEDDSDGPVVTPGRPLTFDMAEEARLGNGTVVQVHEWMRGATLTFPPDEGHEWQTVDAEVCLGDRTSEVRVARITEWFTLQFADNSRVTPERSGNPGKRFSAQHDVVLSPGECVRGTVEFAVPIGEQPQYVVIGTAEGGSLRWEV